MRRSGLVVSNWVGKFFTDRITMTPPILNNAACVVFLVSGEEKALPLKAVLEGYYEPEQLPAQVDPTGNTAGSSGSSIGTPPACCRQARKLRKGYSKQRQESGMELTQMSRLVKGSALDENRQRSAHWNRWGPYRSERAWGRYVRTIAPMVRPGTTFPTTTPAREHTAGTRTDWAASAIAINISASPLPCGMAGTRS